MFQEPSVNFGIPVNIRADLMLSSRNSGKLCIAVANRFYRFNHFYRTIIRNNIIGIAMKRPHRKGFERFCPVYFPAASKWRNCRKKIGIFFGHGKGSETAHTETSKVDTARIDLEPSAMPEEVVDHDFDRFGIPVVIAMWNNRG